MTRSGIVAHLARRTAPGPRGGLILGNLLDVAQGRMFELLHHMWRAHGDISCARVGARLLYLVVHPDQIQHVLVTRRDNYTKAMHRARPLIGDGLPASNGELWARQRRLLTPRFQVGALPQFAPPLRGAITRMLARWQAAADRGDEFDLADEMVALTLDAILGSLMGERLDDSEARLRAAIRDAVEFVAASRQLFRLPLSWPTARNQRFSAALAVIDDFVQRAIEAHRTRPPDDPDLLTFLLRNVGDGETAEVPRLVRDEAVSLLLGGHESTAQALTWLLYCLDLHPEARARVMTEVDAFGDALPAVADRNQFPFLTAAAQEALRLYPPFWAFPRHTVADDELGGYHVPAGATVMLCPYLTHRHPALWDAPERFLPERFLGGVAQGRARAAYLPFGYGPRTCIGNHMATTEIVLATAAILRRFEVERVQHAPVAPEFSTTLRPHGGIRIKLRARRAADHGASARST